MEQSEQWFNGVNTKWSDAIHVDNEGSKFQSSQEKEVVHMLEDAGNKEH